MHARRTLAAVSIAAMTLSAAGLSGCASQSGALVGTWTSSKNQPTSRFDFRAVTFAPDGTYTAQAIVEGEEKSWTGGWRIDQSDRLVLEQKGREYVFDLYADAAKVEFIAPDTGMRAVLRRFKAGDEEMATVTEADEGMPDRP